MPSLEGSPRRRRISEETSERSTSGWGAVARRQAEIAERRSEMENQVKEFYLKDGESATIQFLHDEPYCYDAHSVRDKNGRFSVVPCQLNTQRRCEMCSRGIKQTWRAAFKILDYRGSWDKDKKKFTYDKPVEKIWKVGATIANQLKSIHDRRGKELTEMVLEVTRSGSNTDTTYNFEPAFDDDDRKRSPIPWKEATPPVETLCQPPTDDEIDASGYSDSM